MLARQMIINRFFSICKEIVATVRVRRKPDPEDLRAGPMMESTSPSLKIGKVIYIWIKLQSWKSPPNSFNKTGVDMYRYALAPYFDRNSTNSTRNTGYQMAIKWKMKMVSNWWCNLKQFIQIDVHRMKNVLIQRKDCTCVKEFVVFFFTQPVWYWRGHIVTDFVFHVHWYERETRARFGAHVTISPYLSTSYSVWIIKMVVCSFLNAVVLVSCTEIN